MKWSLQINGNSFSNENFLEIDDSETRDFLEEWGNDSPTVTVKTSGSTGEPKLISLLKSDMVASARLTGERFQLHKGQSALLCLPVKYIAGKMMVIRAIVLGLDLISVTPSSNPLLSYNQKIDFAAMTPMQVKTILNKNDEKLDLIDQLIIGGALVNNVLKARLQNIKTRCYSTYGMTETITHIAVKTLNGKDKTDTFKALTNVTFELNKDDCLIVKTPHLSTSTTITNDVVKLLDNQNFKWVGRFDNTINSGGVKIQPEALEIKITDLTNQKRFFFSSIPDDLLGEKLILVIESNGVIPNFETSLNNVLDTFEMPKSIYYMDSFIETENGKVNRKETILQAFNL